MALRSHCRTSSFNSSHGRRDGLIFLSGSRFAPYFHPVRRRWTFQRPCSISDMNSTFAAVVLLQVVLKFLPRPHRRIVALIPVLLEELVVDDPAHLLELLFAEGASPRLQESTEGHQVDRKASQGRDVPPVGVRENLRSGAAA